MTIKTIECAIVDRAWREGWIRPEPRCAADRQASRRRRLGPGGPRLRPAAGARRPRGSSSSRRTPRPGGLLRYGIPDFKLEKSHIDRRIAQMKAEGVVFHCDDAGRRATSAPGRSSTTMTRSRLAGGAESPRDLPVARARSRGRPFRDGLPAAAEPPRVAASRSASNEPILRRRQARRRHRRRRHRLRLHRHVDPPGRAAGHPARDHADAAQGRRQAADLAELAAEAAHLVEPRGRRGARLRRADDARSRARTAP